MKCDQTPTGFLKLTLLTFIPKAYFMKASSLIPVPFPFQLPLVQGVRDQAGGRHEDGACVSVHDFVALVLCYSSL